jgi:hypothetical protein
LKLKRFLTVLSVLAALVAVTALAGWVRSYWIVDQLRYQGWKTDGDFGRAWIVSDRGSLKAGYAHFAKGFYLSPYTGVADYPNGFAWLRWHPQISDDASAVYKRLGVDWTSDDAPGAYRTWIVQVPHWLLIVLASLLPARWLLARRADRKLIGFDVATRATPTPAAVSTVSSPSGTLT